MKATFIHAPFKSKYCQVLKNWHWHDFQTKRLQETGSQKGNFNWNSKTKINSFLGIQLTHASNFDNFQPVLQFHRFTKATTSIS